MTAQQQAALKLANAKRLRVASLRRDLRAGRIDFRELILNPPPDLWSMTIIDVIRWPRSQRALEEAWARRLGRRAIHDQINLLKPLGATTEREREWVATHATWHLRLNRKAA